MKAMDIPFVEKLHYFSSPETPRSFDALSPSAKMPVLVSNGYSIWDTLSIVEYLAEEYPNVWPTEKINRAWARSACAEMHSGFIYWVGNKIPSGHLLFPAKVQLLM